MPSVGEVIEMPDHELKAVCEGDECKGVPFELGRLYVVKGEVREGKLPSDFGASVWEVLKSIRKKYPGVSVTYIWVSDDGKKFEVHLFDPRYAMFPWGIVAVLALILAIILSTTLLTKVFIQAWEKVSPHIPKPPPTPQTPWYWWALLAVAGTFATASLIKSIKG